MSFGFGIGDCIAVIEVVKKIHDRVKDSPDQIKDTRQDVEAISAFIKREETSRLDGVTDPLNRARIHDSLASCKRIVQGLQSDLNKFKEVESGGKGLRMKLKQSVQRLKWDQKENADTRSRMLTSLALLEGEFRRLDSEVLRNTNVAVNYTQAGVERLHQRLDTKDQMIERQNQVAERQAILDWICSSEIDYVDQQKALKKRRQRGIGEWFVDSQNFKNWLNADGSALLCSGRPGVGKTMITSFVVNRVLEKHNNDPQVGIAYIYCQFARQKEQTPGNLLSSILRQLVERHSVVPAKVKSLYQLSLGKEDLSPADLTDLLDIVLGSFRKRIIIIDALDEMQSSTGAQSEFVSRVLAIRQKFGIQLYVTSRTIQEIARKAPDASQMEICAREEDMRCSLANILKTGPLLSNRPDLQKRALSKILQIADGIFLLAVLYAKHLASFELMKNLSKALDGLRSTSDPYSVVYASTMQRIQDNGGGDTNMALTIICWLLLARRPLRLREMLHALAIDESTPSLDEENVPTVAQITHACAGLVDVDRSNDTIGLFHKTFHEYLDKNQSTWFPLGHQTIGKTCVGYLSLQVFADGPCPESNNGLQSSNSLEKFRPLVERVRQYPLYEYSCFYWADHVRGNAAESEVEVLRFLKDSKKVSASCQDGREYHPDTTGLHVALENLLLQSSIRHLENNRLDVNATDHRGRSPLSYAVKLGNLRVVEMLLERGANSNFEDYPQHTRSALTPLARAASHGSTAIMQALFSRHAHVDLRDRFGRTALSFAAAAGEEPALRLLLDHGARPDQSDSSGRTIISYAAEAGSDTIVTLLLRLGVEADPIDDHRGTPLIYAARNGSAATMSILIAEGANLDASDWEQESPLSLAVRSNMETTAQSLIFRGAKVKTLNNSLQSPLHHAAIIENVQLIKLLIDAGSNKEAKDNEGLTPLGYAAKAGSVATVRSLLSHGCNADSIDHKGRSWLSYAAGSGSAETVRLLLDHGAQTTQALRSARSGPIYYVLEAASQNQESVEILKILLERGVNANRTMAQMYPQPPLIDALKILSPLGPLTKQLIKLLLDHGANTQWKDGQGKSVLMYANHQEEGIRDLLRQYGAS